jgi:glycosyltransferase involved in cell wall biosynthesis
MSYSIIIPAYNEEEAIRSVLIEIVDALNELEQQYEIIVVNDCSTDRTGEEVASSGLPIVLIDHNENLGYGASLKTGIKNSKNDLIVITDADGTYPNKHIPNLVRTLEEGKFDMVVGARTGENVAIPLVRKPAKWFIGKLANYLSGEKIPDLNSGLRVMRKNLVLKHLRILPNGFSFTTTITLAMLTNGNLVEYVSVDYFKRQGKSKIRPIRDTINFFQLIIRTTLYFKPLKIFLPLSFALALLGLVVLIVSHIYTKKAMDVTFGIMIMTAVMVAAIGLLADLIDKRLG